MAFRPQKLSIEPDFQTVIACARVLNADADGDGFSGSDGKLRDQLVSQIVCQYAILHSIMHPAVRSVMDRAYDAFNAKPMRRRMPKSKRMSGPGH